MKKNFALAVFVALFVVLTGFTALAAGYSSAWYQENGIWKVKGPDGQTLKNCWFCDDAVFENGLNIWYLIDADGNMVSHPLVRDWSGNYYSLETNHDGIYGSLRYMSGTYDQILMRFSDKHDGTFGALTNKSAIEELMAQYGVKQIFIDSNNCVYSSSWLGKSGDPAAKAQSGLAPDGTGTTTADNVYRTITYRGPNGTIFGTDSGNTRYFIVRKYDVEGFLYWVGNGNGTQKTYQPGDMYYFEGNQTGETLFAFCE